VKEYLKPSAYDPSEPQHTPHALRLDAPALAPSGAGVGVVWLLGGVVW
jgi:hypothetical protein